VPAVTVLGCLACAQSNLNARLEHSAKARQRLKKLAFVPVSARQFQVDLFEPNGLYQSLKSHMGGNKGSNLTCGRF